MAGNKVNTLVNNFNTTANLNLAGDQEEQVSSFCVFSRKKEFFCIS
jgi:hypothetical protein